MLYQTIKRYCVNFFRVRPTRLRRSVHLLLSTVVLFACQYAFADEVDPLAGVFGGIIASLSAGGGARTAAYIAEGVVATYTFIKTKNILGMFFGIIVIEIFFRIVMKMIGVA